MWYKWAPPPPGGANPVYSDFSQFFYIKMAKILLKKGGDFVEKFKG